MKRIFRIIGLFALLAVIAFSFATCGEGDDDDGGNKVMGLSYSAKAYSTDWRGSPVNSYLLTHSYEEALGILVPQLGQPEGWCNPMGTLSLVTAEMIEWTVFQELIDDYRLLTGYVDENGYTLNVFWSK
jgi:hypothetical protein